MQALVSTDLISAIACCSTSVHASTSKAGVTLTMSHIISNGRALRRPPIVPSWDFSNAFAASPNLKATYKVLSSDVDRDLQF